MNKPLYLVPLNGRFVGGTKRGANGFYDDHMEVIALAAFEDSTGEVSLRYVASDGTGVPVILPPDASVKRASNF